MIKNPRLRRSYFRHILRAAEYREAAKGYALRGFPLSARSCLATAKHEVLQATVIRNRANEA